MPLSLFGSRRKWPVGNSFDGQTRQEETTIGEGEACSGQCNTKVQSQRGRENEAAAASLHFMETHAGRILPLE